MKSGSLTTMLPFFVILIVAIGLGAAGQIMLKAGLKQLPADAAVGAIIASIFTNTRVFAGFVCYGLSSLIYLVAIKHLPLSLAYPMVALSYVLVVAASWKLFNEEIPPLRIAAIAVILAGVVMLAFSSENGGAESGEAAPSPAAMSETGIGNH